MTVPFSMQSRSGYINMMHDETQTTRCKKRKKKTREAVAVTRKLYADSRLLVALRFSRSSRSEITRFARDNTGHRPPQEVVYSLFSGQKSPYFVLPFCERTMGGGLNYYRCDYYDAFVARHDLTRVSVRNETINYKV